ncbi:unnamed protein product [Brassica oleracea var. botrytis]|uniref:Uncharacterized protein n=1 Tax=Brassica oleracea TaxID=3712 RepID=A0A3P6D544_BRAOL|nr:unnamed protein product [Brassica oleracea]
MEQLFMRPTSATVSNHHHHHHQGGSLTAGLMISCELESGGGSSSGRPNWGVGGGEGGGEKLLGQMYHVGYGQMLLGLELVGLIFLEMPGLELGFAQEGNVGVFNQHSFTQIYQQMTQAQVQAQGRVLHHTLHHNPSHEDHHQQESDEKDDSQGSGL